MWKMIQINIENLNKLHEFLIQTRLAVNIQKTTSVIVGLSPG